MKRAVWIVRVVAVLILALVWEWAGGQGGAFEDVFPPISSVLGAWWDVVRQPSFGADVRITVREVVGGFTIGSLAGLFVGSAIGTSKWLTRVMEPMLFWASGVPKIVLLPILLAVLGAGVALKVGHATLSSFFPVALGTATAIRTVPEIYGRVSRTIGARTWHTAFLVYVPAAAGQILTALRLGFAVSIVSALLAETAVATAGLGFRAIHYYQQLRVPEMYAVILTIFVVAMVANVALERWVRVYTRHFEDDRGARVDIAS